MNVLPPDWKPGYLAKAAKDPSPPKCYVVRYSDYKFGFLTCESTVAEILEWEKETADGLEIDKWVVTISSRSLNEQLHSDGIPN